MKVIQNKFSEWNGSEITSYTMVNDHGMEVGCINYGCVINKILVPDKHGNIENVVLGFDNLEDYRQHSPYFGAVVGRHAGRIANGEFELDGKKYELAKNNNGNHLHGGLEGFDKVIWKAETIEGSRSVSVHFSYFSRDGEEGYPGNLEMEVIYTLTNKNELIIGYKGISDKRTLLNITNHTYFNLSGNLKRTILDHKLTLKSNEYVRLNEDLLPTGEFIRVEGTVFDFRTGRFIKDGAESKDSQTILAGNGYDHPFILSENNDGEILLEDSQSGRVLQIETDQPCVVLYTGNQLEDTFSISGVLSKKYLGLCLETQGVPDSIHHPHFPSVILEKGEVYQSVTKYRFL